MNEIQRNSETVCDDDAIRAWREFAEMNGYDLNDMKARKAFGSGYLAGCVWGTESAMSAAAAIIRAA